MKKKGTKVSKADVAIGKIRKLYAIEKRIEKLPQEEKTRQRQQLAQPVLDDLKAWLEKKAFCNPRCKTLAFPKQIIVLCQRFQG
ncbi:IS66 family transposase [Thiolapillus sp.]|uniref:IS66 family transposase n=1 Tax=Thiolapillus sp. TaxID=2017437 RepID=UPI003AF70E4C